MGFVAFGCCSHCQRPGKRIKDVRPLFDREARKATYCKGDCMTDQMLKDFEAVLCDPKGKCCISGSEADRAIVDAALDALRKARTQPAFELIEECRAALYEELVAWDIDPPLHHVKQAHDRCVEWLARQAIAQPVRVGSPNLLQPATGLDLLAEVRRLRGALDSIASYGVPYHDDFDGTASLSDFGGNTDDYAFHLKSINDALIGDIARAAIASLPKEK